MKLFFSLMAWIPLLHGGTLFEIHHQQNISKAKQIKKVMQHRLFIPDNTISIKELKGDCSAIKDGYIKICVDKNGEFKVNDQTEQNFATIKHLFKEQDN